MAENIVITVDVQNEAPYNAKLSEAGTFGRGETPVPGNFVDSITLPTSTELDENAIAVASFVYTTQAEWLSDTQIGEAFYIGTRGKIFYAKVCCLLKVFHFEVKIFLMMFYGDGAFLNLQMIQLKKKLIPHMRRDISLCKITFVGEHMITAQLGPTNIFTLMAGALFVTRN